ncbi:hypothetical protein Tco_0589087, partial [Tanacetum coccineum]
YGITDTWDKLVDAIQEGAPTTLEGVNTRVTELAETHKRDTQDLYAHLEDAHDSRAHLSGKVDILLEDRQFHQQTVMLIEDDARVSREKMPPKRRAATTTTSAPMTDAQIKALISQGVANALYNQHFQELALMCGKMFPKESDEVEKYVGGLLDMIQGSVMVSKSKKMQDAVEFATKLMDQKIHTMAERQAENKRKQDDNFINNQNQ